MLIYLVHLGNGVVPKTKQKSIVLLDCLVELQNKIIKGIEEYNQASMSKERIADQ